MNLVGLVLTADDEGRGLAHPPEQNGGEMQ